ncbi:MAG: GreA/GreB family elongation factor [Sedimentisphaerales bacterium]|nr:GreA/GreB family elongation factor [Sedimentisphaerales bacterium]
MDIQKLRQIIRAAISKRPPSELGYYHICWWEKHIQCLPFRHTDEKHGIFFHAGQDTFKNGLSAYQYNLIESRIRDFCKSEKITLVPTSDKKGIRVGKYRRKQKLQITEFDSRRLTTFIINARTDGFSTEEKLSRLERLLENSEVVSPESIPANVITMNSKLRLKECKSGNDIIISLVFPHDEAVNKNYEDLKVSVLSPIGLSVFGREVGETVSDGIKVQEILFQPEATGRFDL